MTESNLVFQTLDVTPDQAMEWLTDPKFEAPNRHIRKSKREQFAASMRAGAWRETGEAIKFNTGGQLVDGQHRLHAVVDSGCTVKMTVIWGVTPEAANVLDTGAARTAGDVLRINETGGSNAMVTAAAAKLLVAYYSGELTPSARSTRLVTSDRVLDFVQQHADFLETIETNIGSVKHIPIPGSHYLAALYLMARVDRDSANEFTAKMATGVGLSERDAVLTLRERMMSAKGSREYHTPYAWMSVVLRAFMTWRRGETLQRVIMYGPGNQPIPIPELVPANQDQT